MSRRDLRTNPYVGLRPFFAEDSRYFYGREQQTAELLEILRSHRFLGVVGSSGSGKSSLVRAGLMPGLLGGFLVQDRDRWRTVQCKPGDAPLSNLCGALLEAMGGEVTPEAVATLEQAVREEHTGAIIELLRTRLERNANLFVLVDQFEEVFAFRGADDEESHASLDLARRKDRARRKSEAGDFVDLLLALAEQRELPIYVALTMRTDFLGDCDLFYGLPEALNRGRYLVPRMTREQLRDAVECPVRLLSARMAPRLLDYVLNELGDRFDRLPVLQHALLRTWDEWQRAGAIGLIDLRHFEAAGGLEGALGQDAEAALHGLDAGVTARVFKRLTDTDVNQRRIRSPARISELMAVAGTDRATIEAIVRRFEEDGRSFLHSSADGQPSDPRVDISHESLIRQWARLRTWVDEERRSRDQYRELVARAKKKAAREAALLQEPELQVVADWRSTTLPSSAWAQRYSTADGDFASAMGYLDESVEKRCLTLAEAELERRWKKIWRPLALVSVVGIAVALGLLTDLKGLMAAASRVQQSDFTMATTFLRRVARLVSGGSLAKIGFMVVAGVGLISTAKRAHRRFAFPKILERARAAGGRNPFEVEAHHGAEDAITLHHTTYAGTFRRVVAHAIDLVCFLPLLFVDVVIFEALPDGPPDVQTLQWAMFCCLVVVSSGLYTALQISSKHQATFGMRAVGIFRTDLHGQRLSLRKASAWFGYRILSYLSFGLGFLAQLWSDKKQFWHDRMAGTVVLRRPPAKSSSAVQLELDAPLSHV